MALFGLRLAAALSLTIFRELKIQQTFTKAISTIMLFLSVKPLFVYFILPCCKIQLKVDLLVYS